MSSEFDIENEFDLDGDFEEFAGELDDLELATEDSGNITLRTAVLKKNEMVALLCIKSASQGAAICRVDPREHLPSVQVYDDPNAAQKWFTRSLRSSKKNGWSVVYDGLPLQG